MDIKKNPKIEKQKKEENKMDIEKNQMVEKQKKEENKMDIEKNPKIEKQKKEEANMLDMNNYSEESLDEIRVNYENEYLNQNLFSERDFAEEKNISQEKARYISKILSADMVEEQSSKIKGYGVRREHIYTDEKGKPVEKVVRKETEDPRFKYLIQHWKNNIWVNGQSPEMKKYPYNLPGIIEAVKMDKTILICTGEKSADTINQLNVEASATTAIGRGLNKWRYDNNDYFDASTRIFIMEDDSEYSRNLTPRIKNTLEYKVRNIGVFKISNIKEKLGIYDDSVEDICDLKEYLKNEEKIKEIIDFLARYKFKGDILNG